MKKEFRDEFIEGWNEGVSDTEKFLEEHPWFIPVTRTASMIAIFAIGKKAGMKEAGKILDRETGIIQIGDAVVVEITQLANILKHKQPKVEVFR